MPLRLGVVGVHEAAELGVGVLELGEVAGVVGDHLGDLLEGVLEGALLGDDGIVELLDLDLELRLVLQRVQQLLLPVDDRLRGLD